MEETPVQLPPEPEKTGVTPEQRVPTQAEAWALVPTVEGKGALSASLGTIGEGGFRSHAAFTLLQGHVIYLEADNRQLRSERDTALQKTEDFRERYHTEKQRAAVLEIERDSAKTVNRLRQVVCTVGAGIGSWGLGGLTESPTPVWVWPAVIVGVVLLLAGWFLPDRRTKKSDG